MQKLGKYILFLGALFKNRESFKTYVKLTLDECILVGINSIVLVSIVSIFMGAVSTLQTAYNLVNPLIPDNVIGLVVRDLTILELAPTITGIIFGLVWIFGPNRGLISRWRRISKQRFEVDLGIVLTHIHKELGSDRQVSTSSMSNSLGWTKEYSKKLSEFIQEQKFVEKNAQGNFALTDIGLKKVENYSN